MGLGFAGVDGQPEDVVGARVHEVEAQVRQVRLGKLVSKGYK